VNCLHNVSACYVYGIIV